MSRILATMVVAGTLTVGVGALPAAASYQDTVTATVSDPSVAVGEPVTVTASGFRAGSTVTATARRAAAASGRGDSSVLATKTVTADAGGAASVDFSFEVVGAYSVTLAGVDPQGARVSSTTALSVGTQGAGSSADAGDGSGPAAGGSVADSGSSATGAVADAVLAHTGGSLVPVWVGAGLVLLGGGTVVVARSRRQDA